MLFVAVAGPAVGIQLAGIEVVVFGVGADVARHVANQRPARVNHIPARNAAAQGDKSVFGFHAIGVKREDGAAKNRYGHVGAAWATVDVGVTVNTGVDPIVTVMVCIAEPQLLVEVTV